MSFYGFVLLSFAIVSVLAFSALLHLQSVALQVSQHAAYESEYLRCLVAGEARSSQLASLYGIYFNCTGNLCLACDKSRLICAPFTTS